MKLNMKEQYRRNSAALKEAQLSPKKRTFLRFTPFIGLALFFSLMLASFYEWGDGDIGAVSSAVWQLYTTDQKMVQITEQPLKYLTLSKYVEGDVFVETMKEAGWAHVGLDAFSRNGQVMQLVIQTETRNISSVRFYVE